MKPTAYIFLTATLGIASALAAEEPLQLIDPAKPLGGWTFDNGREFPGAVGKLELADDDDQPTLHLHGDFSGGGQYVQAATRLDDIPLETVSFEIKVPAGVGMVTTRLIDGSGQCHQLKIRLNDKGGWQKYVFPVARYFDSVEAGAPMDIVTQYEKWSGANDSKWHQPAKLFVILAGREQLSEGSISIRNVQLERTPPKTDVTTTIRHDEIGTNDTGDWDYNNGNEFKGAKGGLASIAGPSKELRGLALSADFSGGGQYVGVRQNMRNLAIKQTNAIHLKVRSENVEQFSLRLNDTAGQTHQRHGYKIAADGQWHDMTIEPEKVAGGEHWGGPNDGQWRGAVKLIEIMLNGRSSDQKQMRLDLADIRSDVVVEATVSSASTRFEFDTEAASKQWQTIGDSNIVSIDNHETKALVLKRDLANRQRKTTAESVKFPVDRGVWKLAYRWKAKLHSPDNSFHGRVALNVYDKAGTKIETLEAGVLFGEHDWQQAERTFMLPPESATASWHVQLNKTYGELALDDFSAVRLEVQPIESRIESVRISSDVLGNLFHPGDNVAFEVTAHTFKSLPQGDRVVRYNVVDYRGEVVHAGKEVPLTPGAETNRYQGQFELPKDQLNIGQFYELHVEVPQGAGSPFREFAGFAILPQAVAKEFSPAAIPFTIRNWDSRIREYFYLADRLGIRTLGVWGGWRNQPPYRPSLPGLEIVEELDAQWITGTPASDVERNGFKNVSEESLRQGMTNFLEAYADRGLAKIALGNEPHGTGQTVLDNVRAYRTVYEAVKAHDKEIEVIATSVEPNEEYFKAGYQNYCDSYDFHIYEHYSNVRKTMREYRQLMQKYDAVKPIHSTELGLNSQGQARLSVAIELVKKCTVFFAEGGSMVSWFTIQYPDPQGKARGQFGDAHCVFDCKFNNYNPRLDAIALYNMVNGVAAKKFVKEKQHRDGLQEFLFRDAENRSLTILWNDEKQVDATVYVPAGTEVEIIRIDGQRSQQTSGYKGVTVSVGEQPLLLLY